MEHALSAAKSRPLSLMILARGALPAHLQRSDRGSWSAAPFRLGSGTGDRSACARKEVFMLG
jgi:hypothetical protein